MLKRYKEMMQKYAEAMKMNHGWEEELDCPQCQKKVKPIYQGWVPNNKMNFGNTPTIFANITCPGCNLSLREQAGRKLVELFSSVPLPQNNKKLIVNFSIYMVVLVTFLIIALQVWKINLAPFSILLILPAIFYFNYKIALARKQCQCGKPNYIFMGLLGRSYCHKCLSCGKLLRSRD